MTGAETAEGFIPDLHYTIDSQTVVMLKVKLKIGRRGRLLTDDSDIHRRLPYPVRESGRLVYALPGG